MIRLFAKKSTYWFLRIIRFGLLIGYLLISHDLTFSMIWVFGYLAICVLVAWIIVGLELPKRLPKLDRYYFFRAKGDEQARPLSDGEWGVKQAEYLQAGFRNKAILFTPAEDALICVPVLLIGISPISAILGGAIFGFLHLGRFTYLDCISKAVIYSLICLFVLPHGLLTVVAGHFATDLLGLAMLKIISKQRK